MPILRQEATLLYVEPTYITTYVHNHGNLLGG